jgi:beta-lactamase regulating signal transducer with metallopeptidase domain
MIEWIVSSSALLAVLILLRQLLKGKIGLRLQYALWGLALLRLLVPVSFGSTAVSVANALPEETRSLYARAVSADPYGLGTAIVRDTIYLGREATIKTGTESSTYQLPRQQDAYEAHRAELKQKEETFSIEFDYHELQGWIEILLGLWIAGMAAAALCLFGSNLRFALRLRKTRKLLREETLPVYLTEEADTPCLFGLIRPAVYVTPEAAEDPARLRHVIEHELTHYRHADHLWSLLRGVCLILHWYNPLVWWAAILSRRDCELACDEATIRRLGEGERSAYGRTLLYMTCLKRPAILVTATTMTGSKGSIKERISLLVKKPRTAILTLAAVLLAAAVAVGCTFTGGKTEKTQPTATPTEAPATAAPSAEPTAAPGPTPTEGPAADIPASNLFLPSDSMDYETVARDYAGAYAGQFLQAGPDSPYKAYEAVVDTRVMEIREDGEAFIFQAHIGFAPAEPDRFAGVIGAGNGGWNEEQQRFYVWRYFCLEKTEGGWTGVDLDVLNWYDEYTAVYGDYFASVPTPSGDEAIHRAVMDFNRGNYKSGEFACESHVLVAEESAPGSGGTTAETYYLMILYQEYDRVDGAPRVVGGSYIPSALTFGVSPEGEYTLLEYWTPRDGTYYWDDLRGKFPAGVPDEDLNNQNPKYVERLHTSCDAQARAYFALSTSPADEVFLDMANPLVENYCRRTGRLCPEGGTVVRYADGVSADVFYPTMGKRYTAAVRFLRGEDGSWAPADDVRVIEDRDRGFAELRSELGDQNVPEPVLQYAMRIAQQDLDYYEDGCGYVFDEAKLTGITRIDTGTAGLNEAVNLYLVEYRFLPAPDQEILLAGGMTMEDGYLTEWSSTGQPYLLMFVEDKDDGQHWTKICTTNTDTILTEYGTPEMLEKYGNAYTAAAMELKEKYLGRAEALDPRDVSVFSPASSPEGIGLDWAYAFTDALTAAAEGDPCRCEAAEVRSSEYIAESLLPGHKTYVYTMEFACDPADEAAFLRQLGEGAGRDTEHPDWLCFRWFVVLEKSYNKGWECAQAGVTGYGGWGYLNYDWDVEELLEKMVTEQVGGEDALMLLPLIDWGEADRLIDFDSETWNALWRKCKEACISDGRSLYDRTNGASENYVNDQRLRNLYVILGFLHSDGAYAEGLASLMYKQYRFDPALYDECVEKCLTEEQQRIVRLNLENERSAADPEEGLRLEREDITLFVGDWYTLPVTLSHYIAPSELVWVSDDPEVVSVAADGTVTARSQGKAVITAAWGEHQAQCIVRVMEGSHPVTVQTATVRLYDGPTREQTPPTVKDTITYDSRNEGDMEIIDTLKGIIDRISYWENDDMLDRVEFDFDGDLTFSDRQFTYYFSYDKRTIYYDHYFGKMSKSDAEVLQSLAG